MKAIHKITMTATFLICIIYSSQAQGWVQGRRGIYSAGIGVGQAVFIPVYDYPGYGRSSRGVLFNISGEYPVHPVIGLGWESGINIFVKGRYYNEADNYYYTTTSVGIPMAFKMNVHILEAARASIRDKLDVYAGFNLGGGPSFHRDPYGGVHPFFFVGPQAGVRYWIDNKIGVFGELGWGVTIVNFGISF